MIFEIAWQIGGKKAKDATSILKELLEEQTKLAPFLTMLPHCAQLLKVLISLQLVVHGLSDTNNSCSEGNRGTAEW